MLYAPIKGIIFDVDGTIINTMVPQHTWLKQTAEKYGGTFPWKEFCPEFLTVYNKFYEEQGMKGLYTMIDVDFEKHSAEIWNDYNHFNQTHEINPVRGVVKAIKEIYDRSRVDGKRKVVTRIALNTTKSWKDVEVPLRKAGLIKLVDTIVTKDDIYDFATNGLAKKLNIHFDDYATLRKILPEETVKALEKPNGYSVQLTSLRLGIHPLELIAFEDTNVGINANKKVKFHNGYFDVKAFAVSWGYQSTSELRESNPDGILTKPKEMVQLIGDLGGLN